MPEKSDSIQIKRKTIAYIVVILIALASVTPALADYLGPNRTVTETTSACNVDLYKCEFVAAKGVYKYKTVDSWPCSNESKPWKAYPSNSLACNSSNNGYEYWDKVDSQQEVITTYPPATISSSLQNCTLNNGWCMTAPQLSLNGNEPIAGQNIIAIEGSLNGQNFACSNPSCNVPLNEGDNTLSYWALSSFGDSSTMSTLSAKVDSQLPSIAGTLSGTSGSNGWYLSPISFNGSASDVTSGLASFTCTLDGAALGSCSSITINGEGAHILVLTANDNAGNIRTLTQYASLDTQNPALNAGLGGTLGSNNWYTSAVLNASASDPTPGSGLSTFEYNLDNSNWIAFPVSGVLALPDGKHSLDIRAIDNAGRTTSSSKSFWLDSVAPGISLNPSGTLGTNNWYTTNLNVNASSSDETSGIDVFEYSLDNNAWTTYTIPITLTDGLHNISFWAQDQAGLVKQVDRTYQVDTRPPQIAGSISGVSGSNGWYISDVTLSASASDPMPGSGLDAFTYILNNSAATSYTTPLSLTDGQHTIQFNAQDQAGLTYSIDQNVKVDTTHPSLTISTTFPNWIKDDITLNGTAGDSGSGLSKVEISTDRGQTWQEVTGSTSWSYDWNTKNNIDGSKTVHVRATDKAGLITEKTINVGLDNHAPKISLPDSWFQWDTVTLDVWDNFSGISEARVEISDPEGRWPKRVIRLDPNQFPLDFKWDRRFGDDTVAPFGTYDVKVIAFDKLGNMAHHSASIKILLSILPSGPTATLQPYSRTDPTPTPLYTATPISSLTATPTAVVSVFGGIEPTVQATSTPASMTTSRVTPTQTGVLDWLESIFVPNANAGDQVTEIKSDDLPSADSRSTDSQSNVLWGAAAAAMVGAATSYAAEERRKQQEEKERQAALEVQEEERHDKIQAKHMERMEAQRAQEAAWEEARHQQQDFIGGVAAKLDRQDQKEEAEQLASQIEHRKRLEEKKKEEEAELQASLAAYYKATRPAEIVSQPQPQEKSWWEKSLNWVDRHQNEIALGIGVLVGVAAIVASGGIAAPMVALYWAAGAAAVAGGAIAVGTVALNKHYNRDWNENLFHNIVIGAAGAAVTTGLWFLVQTATTSVGAYCVVNPGICSRAEPILKGIDAVEELSLHAKLAYYTWRGDEVNAIQAAYDLHAELMDGGVPGNYLSKELGEDLSELGKDTFNLAQKHGDEIVPIILKYGDEGLEIVEKYGDDGIELLQLYGDDAIKLMSSYGTPAIKIMEVVGPEAGKKLLKTLDDDVLDYTMQQGDDAVEALSHWSTSDLATHSAELALRSKKDAQVLSDVKRLIALGPIDPKHLSDEQRVLINAIAANSTQYAGEGQVVLGKWIDISNGFVERATDTGSVHYNPHPDMWNLLGGLGEENQGEAAWLINQQVVQTGINKGLPFEYTLNGVPDKIIDNEHNAIEAVFAGKTDAQILDVLDAKVMPIRIKELKELKEAGYKLDFDEVNNSYIFIMP